MKIISALRRRISRQELEEIDRLNERLARTYEAIEFWKRESYKWQDAYNNVLYEMKRNDRKNYTKPKQKPKKKESNPKLTLIKN